MGRMLRIGLCRKYDIYLYNRKKFNIYKYKIKCVMYLGVNTLIILWTMIRWLPCILGIFIGVWLSSIINIWYYRSKTRKCFSFHETNNRRYGRKKEIKNPLTVNNLTQANHRLGTTNSVDTYSCTFDAGI